MYNEILHSIQENRIGIVVTCVLLLSAHIAHWPRRAQLPRPAAYIIGCSCVLIGMLISAAQTGRIQSVIDLGVHLGPGGLLIVAAWCYRGWRAARDQALKDAAAIEEQARRAERTY